MTTAEHIKERLKNPNLSNSYRAILEKALEAQAPLVHGFRVGSKARYSSLVGVVMSHQEVIDSGHEWGREANRQMLHNRVPLRIESGGIHAYDPGQLRPAE